MWNLEIISLLMLSIATLVVVCEETDLSRGFNANIDWMNLEDGLQRAKEQDTPIMMLIHKSWCGACKALKEKFKDDQEIEDLSKQFVMVNIMDEEEPTDKKYQPDGGYIPRILFMEPNGEVRADIINQMSNAKYKYFYAAPSMVVTGMKEAAQKIVSGEPARSEL